MLVWYVVVWVAVPICLGLVLMLSQVRPRRKVKNLAGLVWLGAACIALGLAALFSEMSGTSNGGAGGVWNLATAAAGLVALCAAVVAFLLLIDRKRDRGQVPPE